MGRLLNLSVGEEKVMSSSLIAVEEMAANVQSYHMKHEPEVGQGSYRAGAAVIGLYVLGMICGFAFLVNRTSPKTAASAFFILLLSCLGGTLLLWWQDERRLRRTIAEQTQPESFGVASDQEEREAFSAIPT
jgi:protein-S-isoprenylcysteine O-methyltransferase Ste14